MRPSVRKQNLDMSLNQEKHQVRETLSTPHRKILKPTTYVQQQLCQEAFQEWPNSSLHLTLTIWPSYHWTDFHILLQHCGQSQTQNTRQTRERVRWTNVKMLRRERFLISRHIDIMKAGVKLQWVTVPQEGSKAPLRNAARGGKKTLQVLASWSVSNGTNIG